MKKISTKYTSESKPVVITPEQQEKIDATMEKIRHETVRQRTAMYAKLDKIALTK